jgi:uncharacterized protein (TIGR02246 family)
MATLEQRVQRLEDVEAIRRLKQEYAGYCDNAYEPDGLASLFMEDATWDAIELDFHLAGRQKIHDFFAEVHKDNSFALHYILGHVIDVAEDGENATGTWYIWMPATIKGDATWTAAQYTDTYKKVDGRWFFQTVRIDYGFFTTYEKGWVKEPMLVDERDYA